MVVGLGSVCALHSMSRYTALNTQASLVSPSHCTEQAKSAASTTLIGIAGEGVTEPVVAHAVLAVASARRLPVTEELGWQQDCLARQLCAALCPHDSLYCVGWLLAWQGEKSH